VEYRVWSEDGRGMTIHQEMPMKKGFLSLFGEPWGTMWMHIFRFAT